ncbi:MAG: hypothetical protein KDI56_06505 [Xanthomonadales bacterium]|nr:hypothetical protein [Xanthomonadales bacterium]
MTWHPQLPSAPSDFPGKVNFRLSVEEASFLLDRIGRSHPRSLLAHLAMQCEPAQVDAAWHHPDFASFPPDHRELLEHAALFSGVMHAAALLYNIELARARSWQEKLDEHAAALERWVNQLDTDRLRGWSISRLWELTNDRGHAITPATRRFVEAWVARVRTVPQSLNDDADARELVRRREMALKRARSRFGNRRALDQWGGSSGLVPMTFRWPTAARFLRDLSAGLKSGNA